MSARLRGPDALQALKDGAIKGNDQPGRRLQIMHLQRGPAADGHSVERIFADVRSALADKVDIVLWRNPYPNRGLRPRLLAAMAARRVRSEITHVLGDAHFLTWFLPSRGTVLTILDGISHGRLKGWKRALFHHLWYRVPVARAQRITTISAFSAREIARLCKIDLTSIAIIPPAVSPAFTYHEPRPHGNWKRVLHFSAFPNKNTLRVVDALSGMGLTLVTVGSLNPEVRDRIRASDLDHEEYSGLDIKALIEVYAACDLLLYPSLYEGFGMPIIEAQSIGRPVVTSLDDPMPQTAGGAACLVDPVDTSSIRAGIRRVLGDETYARGLIEAGFVNAARYSISSVSEAYNQVYQELAVTSAEAQR